MRRMPPRHQARARARASALPDRRLLPLVAALLALLATLAFTRPPAAVAAPSGSLDITKVDTSEFPYVRIAFTKDDANAQLPRFRIEENGRVVSDVKAFNGKLGRYESNPKPVIMLVLDASDTMSGEKIAKARSAALKLIGQSRAGDRIGLVAFGKTAELVVPPTADHAELKSALNDVETSFGTKMFESVEIAAKSFPEDATRRVIVLLADGEDIKSTVTLDEAIAAASDNGAEIYSVGFKGNVYFPETMQRLAHETSGVYRSVSANEDLDKVYSELGRELLRGYWLEYRSTAAGGEPVKLVLEANGYDTVVRTFAPPIIAGANGTGIQISPLPEASTPAPAVKLPSTGLGLVLASLPFGLLIGYFVLSTLARRSRPKLVERIEPFTRRREAVLDASKKHDKESALAPLYAITESFLGTSALFRRFRFLIEQANLPLREVELLYMMVGGGIGGGLLLSIFMQSLLGTVIGLAFGAMLPFGWVKFKARQRKKQFEDQLADMLSTVASSLRAGHSFNQAITAVIQETPNPTAEELNRVLTEARLGLPMEAALEAMSIRMGSNDFEFAVTAVNIQRTVGGSLAEILEMVSDTVRNRQQFRKKVKALSSMGQMSAYVLLGMPIFMGLLLTAMRPDYMEPLLKTPTGHMMMMTGAFFMVLGYLACQKIVNIKV